MEKVNIRHLDTAELEEKFDFISIDVSFISLKLVFPVAAAVLKENGELVCLVKPQFEAGKNQVGKKGIVKDKKVHKEVILNVIEYGKLNGIYPHALSYSPVTGAKGNIEYLIFFKKISCGEKNMNETSLNDMVDIQHSTIDLIVDNSHEELQ